MKTSISTKAIQNGTFLGKFIVTESTISIENEMTRKEIIEFGDCVYFMYVDGELMKIGKAGGRNGFAGRASTYSRGAKGDSTNKKFCRYAEENGDYEIDIYAFRTPRQIIEAICPITNDIIETEVETHGHFERHWTATYLNEKVGNELLLCTQLK